MGASFAVELRNISKRPAARVIGLIFVLAVVVFGYLFRYVAFSNVEARGQTQPGQPLLHSLYPESFLGATLQILGGLGIALALVLGALAVGSEYGWQTLKVVLTQRPSRLAYFLGKLLALALVMAFFTLLALALGALCSYAVANLRDAQVQWPALMEILKALGAGWLILSTFSALGLFLATLFRGSGLAIALGLIYILLVENLFLGLATLSGTVQKIGKALPARNGVDLVRYFFAGPQGGGAQVGATPPGVEVVGATQATLVLLAYLAVLVLLSVLLFRSRDVAQ